MSERIYQVIIGVLVLVILVGGAMMVTNNRAATDASAAGDSTDTSLDDSAADDDTSDATDDSASSGGDTSSANTSAGNSMVAEGDAVEAADQAAVKVAVASSVTLSKLGWVAVRDGRGWILGAERLTAGTHKNITITLLRTMEAGKSYEMVLYYDDRDMAFDLHKDSLVMKSDGSAVSSAFLAK